MSIKSDLLRNVILPLGDVAFGQQMITRLKFLEKAQFWPYERILDYQNQALKSLTKIAYHEVAFYHDLMRGKGIHPEEICNQSDLSKLEIVTKDMLRAGYPDKVTRKTGQKTYEAFTSGSTGKNFIVREDAETAGWYRATFLLELEWAGWAIGTPHLQTGMNLSRSLDRRLKDWLLGCHYIDAHKLDDYHLDIILDTIERNNIEYFFGYPGSIYYAAKHAIDRGWNRPLKAVVSWGSNLYPHYRRTIEEAFQTKVYDTYGAAEGVQIAAQCEYGNYHLHAVDTIVEFLDDAGVPVKPGQVGNIVVTRLHPGPMPLIRYAIGDIGVPSAETRCPCGRNFPMLQSIKGRSGDVLVTPSGNRLLSEYICGVLEYFPEIDTFQFVQKNVTNAILKIVPKFQITDKKINEIISELHSKGASDLNIEIELVDQIPIPSTGKHRYIISEINKFSF